MRPASSSLAYVLCLALAARAQTNVTAAPSAAFAMDGTDLLAADLTSVDLDLSDSDAAFLRAALEWWDITSSCAENPKMYAAIGGGGRRASVEKGYY